MASAALPFCASAETLWVTLQARRGFPPGAEMPFLPQSERGTVPHFREDDAVFAAQTLLLKEYKCPLATI